MANLTDQFTVKKLTARNRLVLPPLTTNYGDERGRVTPDILKFYKVRSRGMGIVIAEAAAVCPEGRIVPFSLGLWEDDQISGMKELAGTIKAQGAAAVIQINHAGAKAWPFEGTASFTAPSDIACRPGVRAKAADESDIDRIVTLFSDAAIRACNAGFDGVEIHGAHLYLISQFLSPLTNSRTDQYGGSAEKRAALAVRITKAAREKLGPDYPIFFRLNALENLEGGMKPDDAVTTGKLLADAGVDVLDLSLAVKGSVKEEQGGKYVMTTSAYAKDETPGEVAALASRFRKGCGLPVIAVGRLGTGPSARDALDKGADLVAIGRQMICDPGTAEKIIAGKDDRILTCEACQTCFVSLGKGKPVQCKHNKNLPD